MSSDTLILGAACGYRVADVYPFVESLREHYSGDVALLVTTIGGRERELIEYLRSRNIQPVAFDCGYWMNGHAQFTRFIRFNEHLTNCHDAYHRILITDVSDVVFQGHPFEGLPDDDLIFFHEDSRKKIGDCESNRFWVYEMYGKLGLDMLKDNPIVCGGTTIGSHRGMLWYLDALMAECRPEVWAKLRPDLRGHEQAAINWIAHRDSRDSELITFMENGNHVWTLGHVDDAEIVADVSIHPRNGPEPAIVHQWNYRPKAAEYVRTRWKPA